MNRARNSTPAERGLQGPRRTVLRATFAGRMLLPVAGAGIVAAWLFGGTTGLFAVTALAVLALSPLLGWLHVRGLELALPAHARMAIGEPFLVDLLVRNRSRFLAARDVVIVTGDELAGEPRPVGLISLLAPLATDRIPIAQRLIERGRKRELSLVAYSTFPFGLVRCGLAFRIPVDLLGLPRIGSLSGLRRLPDARPELAFDERAARRGEEEFWGVREWRPGESPRRVHWRLSARSERLITREYRPQARPPITLVLCTVVQELGPWVRRDPSFERAVSLTATLGEHYLRAGRMVRLRLAGAGAPATAGRGMSVGDHRGSAGMADFLVRLAEVRPRAGSPGRAVEAYLRGGRPPREDLVVVVAGGGAELATATPALVLDVDDPAVDALFQRGASRARALEVPAR